MSILSAISCKADDALTSLRVPAGFSIGVFADGLRSPRELALGEDGTVYVGSSDGGEVIALHDTRGAGHADLRKRIASGLNSPNGVAVHGGALYVAEIGRILRFPDIAKRSDVSKTAEIVRADLPTETHHGLRYIAFGPDGKLYVAIGAPCNVCIPEAFRRGESALEYGSITRMNADGSHWESLASGIRNSVGFDWSPQDKSLWFTNNGRDLLGDDLPADTLNRISKVGEHFGFPYCHQGDLPDPQFGAGHACSDYSPPALELGAHVASLGMRFYTGQQFPLAWRNTIFIAEHGSWNRSKKVGYRVMAVHLQDGRPVLSEPFADGWLQNEKASGRPVDVLVMPDGALLISDDLGGRIYRVSYTGNH